MIVSLELLVNMGHPLVGRAREAGGDDVGHGRGILAGPDGGCPTLSGMLVRMNPFFSSVLRHEFESFVACAARLWWCTALAVWGAGLGGTLLVIFFR